MRNSPLQFEFGGWHWVGLLDFTAPQNVQIVLDEAVYGRQLPFQGVAGPGRGLKAYRMSGFITVDGETQLRDRVRKWIQNGGETQA